LNKFYQESTLLEQAFIKDAKVSIAQYLKQQNENLTVVDFKRVTLNQE
jgi:elongation factor Ts